MKEINIKSHVISGEFVIMKKEDYDIIQSNSYLWAEKYKKLQEENGNLKYEIGKLEDKILELKYRIKNQTEKIVSLQKENETLQLVAACNINNVNTEATIKAHELEKELTIANETIKHLRDEKIDLLNRNIELTDRIDRNDNEISELNETIEHQEEEINDWKSSNEDLMEELDEKNNYIIGLVTKLSETNNKVNYDPYKPAKFE